MKISNALYPTPVVRFDALAQVVIVEHRNPDTGEESYQVPTEETVRERDLAALAGGAGKSGEETAAKTPAAQPEAGSATDGFSGNRVSIIV